MMVLLSQDESIHRNRKKRSPLILLRGSIRKNGAKYNNSKGRLMNQEEATDEFERNDEESGDALQQATAIEDNMINSSPYGANR